MPLFVATDPGDKVEPTRASLGHDLGCVLRLRRGRVEEDEDEWIARLRRRIRAERR
ncbi:MAG: hypothetical protein K0S14_1303, partial [Thermomicrobiales bacterium]|nr:hypothetical protein [Thermomicrobiales bacterium]